MRPASRVPCRVKMMSAAEAANSRPSLESPAWITTGWPCGERGTVNSPEIVNCSPSCAKGRDSPSGVQESHSSRAVATNSAARL
ncbi:hypothetical protein SMICM17S_11921 [Streptomyces microflavus]